MSRNHSQRSQRDRRDNFAGFSLNPELTEKNVSDNLVILDGNERCDHCSPSSQTAHESCFEITAECRTVHLLDCGVVGGLFLSDEQHSP